MHLFTNAGALLLQGPLPISQTMAAAFMSQASSVPPTSFPGQPLTYTPGTLGIQLWGLPNDSRWGHW